MRGIDLMTGVPMVQNSTFSICRRGGEKRVRNDKLKEALGVHLKFPTFREGLEAIHSGNLLPFE